MLRTPAVDCTFKQQALLFTEMVCNIQICVIFTSYNVDKYRIVEPQLRLRCDLSSLKHKLLKKMQAFIHEVTLIIDQAWIQNR